VWRRFNPGVLLNPAGQYAISSPVGTGKTTFLRHLQSKMLAPNGPLLAFYLPAAHLNGFTKLTWPKLREYLAESFTGILPKKLCAAEFDKAFTDHCLVFLIDGLDQLGEPRLNCSHLVGQVLAMVNGNPIIMAGRPTAMRWAEKRPGITLLKLEPFDDDAQKRYFGDHYDAACRTCGRGISLLPSHIMAVPMLAYLLRLMAQAQRHEDTEHTVRSRWDLYSFIVNHILYGHEPNIQSKNHDEWVDVVTEALGRIAYGTIDRQNPIWSTVPRHICRDLLQGTSVSLEIVPSCGMVDMCAGERNQRAQCLVFGHQSFQEFFAAEWASADQKRLDHVLSEYGNPKWDEVIRFLAGMGDGERIIRSFYPNSTKDNSISSGLFLAYECSKETQISSELESQLSHDIAEHFGRVWATLPDVLDVFYRTPEYQRVKSHMTTHQ